MFRRATHPGKFLQVLIGEGTSSRASRHATCKTRCFAISMCVCVCNASKPSSPRQNSAATPYMDTLYMTMVWIVCPFIEMTRHMGNGKSEGISEGPGHFVSCQEDRDLWDGNSSWLGDGWLWQNCEVPKAPS